MGVDGIKMAAVLFTSMTAACQLHGRLSEHGRERQSEWEGEREKRWVEEVWSWIQRASFSVLIGSTSFLLLLLTRAGIENITYFCQYTSVTNLALIRATINDYLC